MARRTGPLARARPSAAPQRQSSPIIIEDTPAPPSRKRWGIALADITGKSVADYSSSPIIQVTVGTDEHKRTHHLHDSLLTDKSVYFATCLSIPMRERTEKIDLPEDDPDAFGFFVNWAYTGSITAKLTVMDCINTYILADKLMMEQDLFADSILMAFVDATENRWEAVTIEHVLTLLDSGLTETRLADLVIQSFAQRVAEGEAGCQPIGYDWVALLGAEPSVTVRVLNALKKKWQAVASGLEEVDASSVRTQAGSRSTSGGSNAALAQGAKAKKRKLNDDVGPGPGAFYQRWKKDLQWEKTSPLWRPSRK